MSNLTRVRAKSQPKSKQRSKPVVPSTWIGIDLGDRWSEVCLVDDAGEVTGRTRVQTNPKAFKQFFTPFAGAPVAIETGAHSAWASRELADCGLAVTVANAREVRKIHLSSKKNDKADAEILARMLRFDRALLSPVQHRSAEAQADLAIVRARDTVVRSRTRCINAVRGLTKASGHRLPKCSADSFHRAVDGLISPTLQPALKPLLELIASLTAQIRRYDGTIEALAQERYPQTALLRQVDGVGPVTSVAYVLTLGEVQRFTQSRDVGPYLGLVPRQYDSGDQQSQLPITKAGNRYLRRLLVGSAQYILGPFGPDCRLRRFGERMMQRGGKNAKKRAVVAVARKLAVLLHHLWATGAAYDPFYGAAIAQAA